MAGTGRVPARWHRTVRAESSVSRAWRRLTMAGVSRIVAGVVIGRLVGWTTGGGRDVGQGAQQQADERLGAEQVDPATGT